MASAAWKNEPNDSTANSLLAVKITTLPGAGTLTDNGVAVAACASISAADIIAVHLFFRPAADRNVHSFPTRRSSDLDDGGTANGGADLDASANTLTIDVTSVNDAPA